MCFTLTDPGGYYALYHMQSSYFAMMKQEDTFSGGIQEVRFLLGFVGILSIRCNKIIA